MNTQKAIELAGGSSALANLLGITPGAVSQWGNELPDRRIWQLRVLRPEWFKDSRSTKIRSQTESA
jgi:hypothetical protein